LRPQQLLVVLRTSGRESLGTASCWPGFAASPPARSSHFSRSRPGRRDGWDFTLDLRWRPTATLRPCGCSPAASPDNRRWPLSPKRSRRPGVAAAAFVNTERPLVRCARRALGLLSPGACGNGGGGCSAVARPPVLGALLPWLRHNGSPPIGAPTWPCWKRHQRREIDPQPASLLWYPRPRPSNWAGQPSLGCGRQAWPLCSAAQPPQSQAKPRQQPGSGQRLPWLIGAL